MDHVGAMTRCTHDLALVMQTIANRPVRDWMAGLDQGWRWTLGRPRGLFERLAAPDVNAMMDRVCAHLAERGATIHDVSLPTAFEDVIAQHRVVMAVEAAKYHEERLRRRPEDYPPNITALLREGLECPAPAYARAKELQRRLRGEVEQVIRSCSTLICPATPRGAPDTSTTGDPAFNSPWSFTGLPVVSIPTALDGDGMPLGIQLVGPAGSENELFAVAAWCEANREREIGDPPL
jgi:Asp-tRNA(Asn)/Glu-tRNA(Gln) amidotransferase A subunit family amidase